MNFREMLEEKILVYDGSKGFLMMQKGLASGDCADIWNLNNPDVVYDIHKAYVDAGADVIQTNTLQGSRYHLEARGLYSSLAGINHAGVALAKKAAAGKALTAASVGPLGVILAPFGETGFEDARTAFSEQIVALLEAGADILHFETFTDLAELRIAVLAAKELSYDTPLIATISIEPGGRTVMGDAAASAAASLSMLGVDCAGANCGLPPEDMLKNFKPFTVFRAPLCSKPNAGAPVLVDGVVNYGATEDEFYETAFGFCRLGARLIGGCCGSVQSHVLKLRKAADIMNASNEYKFSEVIQSAAAQDDIVELCSHGQTTSFSRRALSGYAADALMKTANAQPPGGKAPVFIESPDGKILTVELSRMLDEKGADPDQITDILSEAGDSGADATLFSLQTGGAEGSIDTGTNVGAGASAGKSVGAGTNAGARVGAGVGAAALLSLVAESARAYHNKPILFHTDDMDALNSALRRYCGVPAVLTPKTSEERTRAALNRFNPVIIPF